MAVKEVIRVNFIKSFSRKQYISEAVLNNNIDTTLILKISKTAKNNSSKRGFIFSYSS